MEDTEDASQLKKSLSLSISWFPSILGHRNKFSEIYLAQGEQHCLEKGGNDRWNDKNALSGEAKSPHWPLREHRVTMTAVELLRREFKDSKSLQMGIVYKMQIILNLKIGQVIHLFERCLITSITEIGLEPTFIAKTGIPVKVTWDIMVALLYRLCSLFPDHCWTQLPRILSSVCTETQILRKLELSDTFSTNTGFGWQFHTRCVYTLVLCTL